MFSTVKTYMDPTHTNFNAFWNCVQIKALKNRGYRKYSRKWFFWQLWRSTALTVNGKNKGFLCKLTLLLLMYYPASPVKPSNSANNWKKKTSEIAWYWHIFPDMRFWWLCPLYGRLKMMRKCCCGCGPLDAFQCTRKRSMAQQTCVQILLV